MNAATDLVCAQVDCTPREALALLRRRAAETESDLEDTALALVGRRFAFSEKNSRIGV